MSKAPQEIHGHDIIDLVASYPQGISTAALETEVDRRFGEGTRFHTCSAEGMTLDDLLGFLASRDKVRVAGGMVFPGGAPACHH